MKYYDDLKFREISEITGINEGSLKTSYYKTVSYIEKSMINTELLTLNTVN
jgi:RNA polymerase sigma-70 factor (ECF subfamily)